MLFNRKFSKDEIEFMTKNRCNIPYTSCYKKEFCRRSLAFTVWVSKLNKEFNEFTGLDEKYTILRTIQFANYFLIYGEDDISMTKDLLYIYQGKLSHRVVRNLIYYCVHEDEEVK